MLTQKSNSLISSILYSLFLLWFLLLLSFLLANRTMLLNMLFLSFVFIVGLVSTFFGFPQKRVLAWFHSLSVMVTSRKPVAEADEKLKITCNSTTSIDDMVELRRVFATFDKNNDGNITKKELKESLRNMGMFVAQTDVEEMVARVDANGDGLIDFDEFCDLYGSVVRRGQGGNEEEDKDMDLKEAFGVFDGDGDGLITVEELGMVLSSLGFNEGNRLDNCKEMISKVDVDGDGMVNFDEFKKMMKGGGNFFRLS